MANHNISKDNFNLELRKLQTNDKAHADTFNPLFETLINNDAALKEDVGEVEDKLTDLGTDIKNIDLSAEKVTLDSSNLKSKNVNDAMNELFQYADSGKRGWVDAIGIPLQKTDSFTTLKNKTINVKNELIQKLKEKHVNIDSNSTLNDIKIFIDYLFNNLNDIFYYEDFPYGTSFTCLNNFNGNSYFRHCDTKMEKYNRKNLVETYSLEDDTYRIIYVDSKYIYAKDNYWSIYLYDLKSKNYIKRFDNNYRSETKLSCQTENFFYNIRYDPKNDDTDIEFIDKITGNQIKHITIHNNDHISYVTSCNDYVLLLIGFKLYSIYESGENHEIKYNPLSFII